MADFAAVPSAKLRALAGPAVRRSRVHGLGTFATRPYRAGRRVIEYTGEIIDDEEVERRYADEADNPHTFLFEIGRRTSIDASVGGNAARYINHSCEPNCEAVQTGQRVFIVALRRIQPGEELFYDYRLQIERDASNARRRIFACRCGSAKCRGTMLEGGRRRTKRSAKKKTRKKRRE
jgi:SET domain-containing protein